MGRSWWARGAALGLIPVLAGCTAGVVCTTRTCVSEVTLEVPRGQWDGGLAEVCAGSSCRTAEIGPQTRQVAIPFEDAGTTELAHVTVRVVRQGQTLFAGEATTTLSEVLPNGMKCGPVCHVAKLGVQGGRLVPLVQ